MSFVADLQEPILKENPDRFVLFPIKYEAIWEMYKKAEASFWTGKWIISYTWAACKGSVGRVEACGSN